MRLSPNNLVSRDQAFSRRESAGRRPFAASPLARLDHVAAARPGLGDGGRGALRASATAPHAGKTLP